MSLDTFEQSLLGELRQHVAARTAQQPAPRRRWTARVAVAGLATAAAVAVAVSLGTGAVAPSPAYAVESAPNGDVVVTVHDLTDASGLEHALAAKGVHARRHVRPGVLTGCRADADALGRRRRGLLHRTREGRRWTAVHPRCRADRRRVGARHRHEWFQPHRRRFPGRGGLVGRRLLTQAQRPPRP